MPLLRITLPTTFMTLLALCQAVGMPLYDYDYFWHLKTGEWIVTHGWTLPATDPFAFTTGSARWVVQGWLFDAVQYQLHAHWGDLGVRLMFTAISVATLSLVYASARLYLVNSAHALLITALSTSAAVPYLSARPFVATNLAFAWVLFVLLKFRLTGRRRWLAALPPTFALWVNLHFGYVTGLALIALFAGTALLERRASIAQALREPGSLSLALSSTLLLASLAALGANPYGWVVLGDTLHMTQVNMQTQVIEWRSPEFRMWHTWPFLLAIGGLFVSRALAGHRAQWLDLLLPMALIGAALMSQRHTPLACIVLAPLIARALASWESAAVTWQGTGRWGAWWRSRAGQPLGELQYGLNGLVIMLTVAVLLLVQPRLSAQQACELRRQLPADAADFVLAHGLTGPLLNDYHTGGYLIHRLHPRVAVFIDGRYNPFTGVVMTDYQTMTELRAGWQERLDHHGIRLAILARPTHGLAGAMQASGRFRLVYADEGFGVLLVNDGTHPLLPTLPPPTLAGTAYKNTAAASPPAPAVCAPQRADSERLHTQRNG